MRCDEVRKTLPLFLYGELSFEEEERMELHVDACEQCREALERERALFRAFDDAAMTPSPELLEECRSGLAQRLAHAAPVRAGFWEKVRESFPIRFHFHLAPAIAQPIGAAAMLLLGFAAARMTPNSVLGPWHSAGLFDPNTAHVRYVEPAAPGQVRIIVDETKQRVLSGSLDDQDIQRLLLAAAKDAADPGLRVESVDLLGNRPESAEVRKALLYSLQHDPNAGVRLKALDGLKQFADDPATRKVLTQVLLTDNNPGVRTQVIDLLTPRPSESMVGVLQELMVKEDNDYIRNQCQKVLHAMNASVETY
jgi:HEAT repeats/Putative zinc-finger